SNEAFVTLATNDTYALGCLVLGSSLQRVSTTRQLVVMITSGVTAPMRQQLEALFDLVVEVNVLDSSDTCNLELLGRPDLSCTFTKFHCWRLTQFTKCVFMDADTLVLQNIDDLFDREELSAAPDAGWPDCFNSGVFVYTPSEETYRSLLAFAVTSGSFDGGDQGLLNSYFCGWATEDIGKHLPFTYNVVSQAFYSYLPAFRQFRNNVKVAHFIGAVKPWHQPFNSATGQVSVLPDTGHSQEFLQVWWNIFMESVQPHIDPSHQASLRIYHQPPSSSSQQEHGGMQASPSSQHDHPQHNPLHHHHHHHHNNNQHQHHHQQPASHGHSETRGRPTTTMDVVYPYTPPSLGEREDPPPPPPPPEHAPPAVEEVPQVVNVPVVYRDYQVLETHYSEQPLTTVDPELPPREHYEARESLQGRPFQPTDHSSNSVKSSGESSHTSQDNHITGDARGRSNTESGGDASNSSQRDKSGRLKETRMDENANPTSSQVMVILRVYTHTLVLHFPHLRYTRSNGSLQTHIIF
ncbi:glycogenin-1, partial [Elysia marginata]